MKSLRNIIIGIALITYAGVALLAGFFVTKVNTYVSKQLHHAQTEK